MPGVTVSGAAWRAGWSALRADPERILLPVLGAGVAWVLAQTGVQLLLGRTVTLGHPCVRYLDGVADPTHCGADPHHAVLALVLTLLAVFVLGQFFWAATVYAAARPSAPEDRPPLGRVVPRAALLAVLLGLGVGVGLGVFLVPGLLVAYLGQYAMTAVVVEGQGPLTAFGASARLVLSRPVGQLVLSLSWLATVLVGAALALVGVWPACGVVASVQVSRWREARAC
jgi:hypothetical protein